jgi:2',3'-cyclic-nucleotide 2'-phosphodiesterase/3'-nucleotidase
LATRAAFLFIYCLVTAAACAEQVTISVLATTDMHGNLFPIDYFTDRPAARGLVKVASLIRQARVENPHLLVVDCGDTIQGSPLESVYQAYVRTGKLPLDITLEAPLAHDPMMLAMNEAGYDLMVAGNHEFNFGLKNLNRAREEAKFPWISANVVAAPGSGERPFAPYFLKTLGGVKVAVIGITTPAVPNWEKPENMGGYRFLPGVAAVKKALTEVRRAEHPDLILVAAHAGLDRDLKMGTLHRGQTPGENMVYQIAEEVPELDAIVFGHSHSELAGYRVGNVLLAQPKNWAISAARLDFQMEKAPNGHWKVTQKNSRLIPVTDATPDDITVRAIGTPYHEVAERYLNTAVAESAKSMDGTFGRVEDTALVDAIQSVQLYYSKADVSLTALFNPRVSVPQGKVTVRQIAALYVYDNELYAIEGNGRMLKEALENAARYFVSCQGARCATPPLTNPQVVPYNYDMAQGVEYEIDLRRPEGDRVRYLTWKGRALDPAQKLRIALNHYRAAGSAGYSMFTGAKVVWRSTTEIRDLMIEYYTEKKRLPVEPDHNWRILPEEAQHTLERQAAGEAKRVNLR